MFTFAKTSSVIAGGVGLYGAYEYQNYLVLGQKKTELTEKITSAYIDLSEKNVKFETLKDKTSGMEWVMTTNPSSMDDLWHFEHLFGREWYAVRNDFENSEVVKSECLKTLKNLSSDKMEYSSKNAQLRKNLYAKAREFFVLNDNSDSIKKIEDLPFNEIDRAGLTCDLGHWNTLLELSWLAKTNESELSSEFARSNADYLLNNVQSFAKKDLTKRLHSNQSENINDLNDTQESIISNLNSKIGLYEINKNSFSYLEYGLQNYSGLIFKIKNIQKGLESEYQTTLSKEIEEVIENYQNIDEKLNVKSKALHDKALKNVEENQMLQGWESKNVISPSRWAEKFEKTKLGLAEVNAEQSMAVAHSTILCVITTQATLIDRKRGVMPASFTKAEREFLESYANWLNHRQ